MREKGQTEVAKTLETPVFSRGIEILTEKPKFVNHLHALTFCFFQKYILLTSLARIKQNDGHFISIYNRLYCSIIHEVW